MSGPQSRAGIFGPKISITLTCSRTQDHPARCLVHVSAKPLYCVFGRVHKPADAILKEAVPSFRPSVCIKQKLIKILLRCVVEELHICSSTNKMTLYARICLGFLLPSRINRQLFFGAKNIPKI
jgi:hypothetical protein